MLEGPRAAPDALTGRWSKILENLSNRLTRQIGEKAASARLNILTATDPAQVLRLAKEAKTVGERAEYEHAIRQFALVGRRPSAEIGTITAGTQQSDRMQQGR
jgi:hypothetical protein